MEKIRFMPKSRRAWIRIVEAFVAILLIAGMVLIILNAEYVERNDPSQEIYGFENSVLRDIQSSDALREDVLNSITPSEGNNVSLNIRNEIESEKPSYLECTPKICEINDECILSVNYNKNVYARSVIITSSQAGYGPKQLKLFCFFKEN